MSNKLKEISITNRYVLPFDDIINIKVFDPNKTEIDKKSHEIFLLTLNMWRLKIQNT